MEIKKSGIYTKGGDKGTTSLLGGRRVPKYDLRIEAYGTVDELMAHTALLRDMIADEKTREELLFVLDKLMSSASIIAADGDNLPSNMPVIVDEDVIYLEKSIDRMDFELPILNSFILPGGHVSSSQAHVSRTVCRRAERIILKLSETDPVDEVIIRFFNRLSDYYFLIARKLCITSGSAEIHWKP